MPGSKRFNLKAKQTKGSWSLRSKADIKLLKKTFWSYNHTEIEMTSNLFKFNLLVYRRGGCRSMKDWWTQSRERKPWLLLKMQFLLSLPVVIPLSRSPCVLSLSAFGTEGAVLSWCQKAREQCVLSSSPNNLKSLPRSPLDVVHWDHPSHPVLDFTPLRSAKALCNFFSSISKSDKS